MSNYRYKNPSDQDVFIIGVGVIKAGKTISSDVLIENPIIKLVADTTTDAKQTVNKDSNNVSGN